MSTSKKKAPRRKAAGAQKKAARKKAPRKSTKKTASRKAASRAKKDPVEASVPKTPTGGTRVPHGEERAVAVQTRFLTRERDYMLQKAAATGKSLTAYITDIVLDTLPKNVRRTPLA